MSLKQAAYANFQNLPWYLRDGGRTAFASCRRVDCRLKSRRPGSSPSLKHWDPVFERGNASGSENRFVPGFSRRIDLHPSFLLPGGRFLVPGQHPTVERTQADEAATRDEAKP